MSPYRVLSALCLCVGSLSLAMAAPPAAPQDPLQPVVAPTPVVETAPTIDPAVAVPGEDPRLAVPPRPTFAPGGIPVTVFDMPAAERQAVITEHAGRHVRRVCGPRLFRRLLRRCR